MIKRIFLLLIIAGLCGCGSIEREKARYTGSSSMCIGGVEYIQFTSGASVAYTPDGKIKTCK